ncbi:MAG: gluconokinase [Chloroflexota bacterium]|nr:gluconokinase [Chloroflexota bacterium]
MILTLDIGSSSLRAMLFDANARALPGSESQIKYEMRAAPDGGIEADADELLGYAERAIDEVLARAGEGAANIAAVASDSLAANVLGVDADGRAVTPVYTYADARGAREVAELRARFDEETTHQRVGTLFHTSYLPARFLWLARERAESFRRARYWMSLGEYFLFRWTGQRACSYSVASWTGLLNRQTLAWDEELLSQLPISNHHLSPLVDHDAPVGTLRAEYAARLQPLRSAKWFPTVGDGAAANIGSGCVDATRIALTIGTSSAMRVTKPCEGSEPSQGLPHGLWSYRVTRDHELIGGALSEGGNLFAWMRDAFHLDESQIERELAALAPDAHGLTVLPFLAGERAPNWNANARGAVVGLSLNTRPIEILRAGLEAIAYRLGLIFELLRGVAPDAREVIASGGALMRSPTWIQIIADTLGVPVIASAEAEATSRGTALLALKALGIIDSLEDLPAELGTAYKPDAARHEIYARAVKRQEKLYNAVVGK